MKTDLTKSIVFISMCFAAFALQSCRKDVLLPETISNDDALRSTKSAVASGSYVVTSFISGQNSHDVPNIASPYRICSAADGTLYVTSPNSGGQIYKISPSGKVSNLPPFDSAYGIKAGANGTVYTTSIPFTSNTATIVKIDKIGVMTTLPVSVGLSDALDLAITPDSTLYIADQFNRRIVKLTKDGVASVFAGKTGQLGLVDGQGENARFSYPFAIRYANDGNLWVIDGDGGTEKGAQTIRKITLDGKVTTFFKLNISKRNFIFCLAVAKRDKDFNVSPFENAFVFVEDETNERKNQLFHLSYDKVLTPITDLLPDGFRNGDASQATFFSPTGIAVTPTGIYVADLGNNAIRKITRKK
jgi:sugar lactone lactonase YvrE